MTNEFILSMWCLFNLVFSYLSYHKNKKLIYKLDYCLIKNVQMFDETLIYLILENKRLKREIEILKKKMNKESKNSIEKNGFQYL